jgi:hypothetical protein
MREKERLLSTLELVAIVAAVLPIFVFFDGPVWRHPYHIDAAVYWSYAPIPFLVLFVLLRRQVLSFAGFLVNTVTALSVKYMVTTGVAFVLWSVFDPPSLAVAAAEAPPLDAGKTNARRAAEGALTIDFDGSAIEPAFLEVSGSQPLLFRSRDGQLHTVRAVLDDGTQVSNRPVLPGRDFEPLVLSKEGRVEVSCTVHEHEHHAVVIVKK